MMMMWMMTRSPALFVLLSLSATTTSVTGLSVRRNSYTPWGPYHVDDWKEMITEDLDDTAMDSKEKSELLELAAKEYKGLADKASEAKVAITVDDKASHSLHGKKNDSPMLGSSMVHSGSWKSHYPVSDAIAFPMRDPAMLNSGGGQSVQIMAETQARKADQLKQEELIRYLLQQFKAENISNLFDFLGSTNSVVDAEQYK